VGAGVTSYEDAGLTANTEYFYRVRAENTAGNSDYSNTASATTLPYGGSGDFTADADILVAGTVEGTYENTLTDDDIYEELVEVESSNNPPKNRYSYLEHKWTIYVDGGTNPEFHLQAYRSVPGEDFDNFVFALSTDDVNYTDMVTISDYSGDPGPGNYEVISLAPLGFDQLNGTVYIRVRDTDQSKGNTIIDGVRVDHMFIRTY
jgi:hypothetical protein